MLSIPASVTPVSVWCSADAASETPVSVWCSADAGVLLMLILINQLLDVCQFLCL